MGTPTHGGTLVIRGSQSPNQWDPYLGTSGTAGPAGYQTPFQGDYIVDPSIWDFTLSWNPPQYMTGLLLSSYELPNPYTVVYHVRQDVYWQNKAPVNGRQFTAADIVFHYDRMLGLGDGYNTESPWYVSVTGWSALLSVVANDKFTVTFNWKQGTNPLSLLLLMQSTGADNFMECSDAVAAYTSAGKPAIVDWHNAISTGPYLLTDYISDSSITQTANPDYWEYDRRWSQNKLPYITTRITLIIASNTTAEAAMRTGKIDAFSSMPVQDALNMMKTNPSIVVKQSPSGNELSIDLRNDTAPLNNLNVRIALQHAINIPLIASSLFEGYATPWPSSLTQNQMAIGGIGYPYPDWTQSLKDEYAFNPTLAKQMLSDAGVAGLKTDCVLESDANQDLWQVVQSELADVGVTMTIRLMDSSSWQAYVITGHKYDALCARNSGFLGQNFDIFRQLMRLTTGYQTNYIMVSDPKIDAWYAQALAASSVDEVNQIVYDENVYVAQQHFVVSLTQPSNFNMVQPWIKGNPGTAALGNYSNGIWIDQDLKKSLGH